MMLKEISISSTMLFLKRFSIKKSVRLNVSGTHDSMGARLDRVINCFVKSNVTIQPSLRPDTDSENPLICIYGDTIFCF